jgi:hypothetical protein
VNIAITSPAKFTFQDLVCADLMFRFLAEPEVEFFPEHTGGEDGLLRLTKAATVTNLEIQVKGSHGDVDLSAIARCLIHYPPRASRSSLLERIYDDPNRFAVLVYSGRCNDAASVYVADPEWAGEAHSETRITASVVEQLRVAYKGADPDGKAGGKLQTARKAQAKSFIDSADLEKLRAALRRVIVVELRREGEVIAACEAAMHGIALDRRRDVLNRIKDHISEAKAQASDAFPKVRTILAMNRLGEIRPADYVLRGPEAVWIDELSQSRALLMSGRTRVGKSDAARYVASEFVQLGYEVRQVFDVQAAERFLQEPGDAPRLVLLDDPLNFHAPASGATLTLIEKLIRRLRPNQALIVAQGQETLLDVAQRATVLGFSTAGKQWIDLSKFTPEFLEAVWRRQCEAMTVPSIIVELVAGPLRSGRLALEPGCLTHLAAQYHRLPTTPTLRDCENLAREDAETLARTLRSDGYGNILLALVVGTSASEPLNAESAAFILGGGGSRLPAEESSEISFMPRREAAAKIALALNYESIPVLPEKDQQRLEFLEAHRIVTVTSDGASFSHPFYRAAGMQAARPTTAASSARLIDAIRRALFCGNPQASKAGARNLEEFFRQLEGRPERQAIISAASDAINRCRFIATRDLCLAFLIRRFNDLSEAMQNELPSWVSRVNLEFSSVLWVDGECLGFDGITESGDWWDMIRGRDDAEIAGTLAEVRSGTRIRPPPQALSELIQYFGENPRLMEQDDMKFLFSCEEAVLRAAASEAWLSVGRENDAEILDLIFSDTHPSVAKQALQGSLRCWRDLSQTRRGLLLPRHAATCATPAGAAAVLPDLTVFGRVEYTGPIDDTPWDLFIAAFPGVMRSLPAASVFNDARLYHVVETAIEHVDTGAALDIVDSVVDWALGRASQGEVLSDFQAGFTSLLLNATSTDPQLRADRVKKILGIQGTAGTMRVVADLVAGWPSLREDEREALLRLIGSNRLDAAWLRALSITRRVVPAEVAAAAVGGHVDFSSADSIMEHLPQPVLSAAVQVYAGKPQPLWWIGTHHSRNPIWAEVIKKVALDGLQPAFDTAWSELFSYGKPAILPELIVKLDANLLDRVFGILLSLIANANSEPMRDTWGALFRRFDTEKISPEWAPQIDECIPAIVDSLDELPRWFDSPYLAQIEKMVQSDKLAFTIIGAVEIVTERRAPVDLIDQTTHAILLLLDKTPPRLRRTCDSLIQWFSKGRWKSDKAVLRLKECRADILEEDKRIKEKYYFNPGVLVNWIHP